MSFEVSGDAYDRFMGRYSGLLAVEFLKLVDLKSGSRVLDVGCGPGALTAQLIAALGVGNVSAVDPSTSFVDAIRSRHPDVDLRFGSAEQLPYDDNTFDACLAQLVVHFMIDPIAGLREMARVTRSGGVVAACVWDLTPDGGGPIATFWRAATELDPSARDESGLPGVLEGQLAGLFDAAGLSQIEQTVLTVRVAYQNFADWWEPYTLGVGPAGAYVAGLDAAGREALRQRCAHYLPAGPFEVVATSWGARGIA